MDSPVSTIAKVISDELMDNPVTKGSIIDVSVNQGIVVLSGIVRSASIVQEAEAIARAQPGVLSVVNELKVK